MKWEIPNGIRINCIAPGAVEGDRIDRVFQERSKVTSKTFEEVLESERARATLYKLVKPEEVATLAVFLASDESSGMTGEIINCSAGYAMN